MKTLIAIVICVIFSSIISSIVFGLINGVIHLPNTINHYGGLGLTFFVFINTFAGCKRFAQNF